MDTVVVSDTAKCNIILPIVSSYQKRRYTPYNTNRGSDQRSGEKITQESTATQTDDAEMLKDNSVLARVI